MNWFIYSLADPRDGRIRYVGKTSDIKKRRREHVSDAFRRGKNHRCNWVRSLVEDGQVPQIAILESGEGDWQEAEKRWIKNFLAAGYDLVNATEGGDGCNYLSPEARDRNSAAIREALSSPEIRARRKVIAKMLWQDPEYRAKVSDSLKGRTFSSETRAKLAAGRRGKVHSSEARAKISAVAKARLSNGMKGKHHSAETRAKISTALAARRAKTNEVFP